ncbi:accessory Sec system translocase SecA2 [Halobacillus campisalis]|uniref:Protein translocase subunit SecA n=1 Tax=Halobacillus campisalis TaxID=435909 RepID=A0ABW2K4X0_9BACI|nr:accessory Sec system translocase SecA2 [Halobacillus campisalis]
MIETLKKVLPEKTDRPLKKHLKSIEYINGLESEISILSDKALQSKTLHFKKKIRNGTSLKQIQHEVFAVVREASKRVLGLRPFDVQLMGGLILSEGNIAEMATGEGKTLAASIAGYLKALEGKGVHVITANEYLAKRDFETLKPLYTFLGMSTGLNISKLSSAEKKQAYKADITYGIGTEFGFDFLRDHMVNNKNQKVQRNYHFALIDEIDSVLIDEAKTPLVIAGKAMSSPKLHKVSALLISSFEEETDYQVDRENKFVNLNEQGALKVEKAFDIENLYDLEHQSLYHYIIQSLRAHVLFKRDVDYIVDHDQIKLVDIFTGRVMDGRTLSDGLHQALEAKESVSISEENKTRASITVQNYFRMYPMLSGMTGTAKTEATEFQNLYGMNVIKVPTNRPVKRVDYTDLIFMTKAQKYKALARIVKEKHQTGQPILIGTTSILQSEEVAKYLREAGLIFQLLNANSVEQEVKLIAKAGQKYNIIIATNMAGRGTDIKLGEGVDKLGGLFVIGTERHDARRIDNQLKGRAGRQGDSGASQFIISLEDELISRFAKDELKRKLKTITTDSNEQVLNKDMNQFINTAQQISEGSNYNIRELTLKLDDVVNDQRKVVYEFRDSLLEKKDLIHLIVSMLGEYFDNLIEHHCPETIAYENWPIEHIEVEIKRAAPAAEVNLMLDYEDPEQLKQEASNIARKYEAYLNQWRENDQLQTELRIVCLSVIDQLWTRHLEMMNRLKEGIGMRQYQQEDPIRLYQNDGFYIFRYTFSEIRKEMILELSQHVQDYCNSGNEGVSKDGTYD